ncbi:MAG: SoxR reducing system RseC family protein [Gammaproteobacteria bacterium]|jgi:sigma-E factor negative regulatory protein RseC|nr:SoxR reducing system RseC family protein [Gammaproteobacteria bacterium]
MFSEIAKVLSIESKYLRLQAFNSGNCSSCSLKPSCGQYLLNSLYVNRELELPTKLMPIETDIRSLKKGSLVQINIEASKLVQLALILYLLPLIGMLCTAFLADLAGFSELVIMTLVVIVLFLSMKFLKHYFLRHDSLEKINISLLPESNMELST